MLRKRQASAEKKPRSVVITDDVREAARKVLPFRLTGDQKKAIAEIVEDMKRPQPMNRLLQGDVGSGKTIVALMAALVAMENGFQVAFMAPTEILAEQHFITIRRLLESSRFRMALLTGATPAKKRREIQAELAGGSLHLVVGTHALVEDAVAFRELGLAIIDEQHRFGVMQRAALRAKGMQPGRAGDDRDADPAHAGADHLRRSRRLGHARDAAGPAADQDDRASPSRGATRSTTSSVSSSMPGVRPTSSIRWWRSPTRSISERRQRWPTTSRWTCSRRIASRCCTAA